MAIFCDFKFEDMEVMYPKIRLEEEGIEVVVVGVHPKGTKYTGKFGYPIKSDMNIEDFDHEQFHGLLLPGGFAPDYMRRSQKMLDSTVAMCKAGKPVAAICHGPWMLCSARDENGDPIVKGRRATSFKAVRDDVINAGAIYVDDKSVVVDGNLITAQTPADLTPFCAAIINGLKHSLRVGGVPEHFNYPISMAIDRRMYQTRAMPQFVIQRCGTGAMISNLKNKSVDVIIALTEGLVSEIAKNRSDIRIIGTYVQSPLCWAISAAKDSTTTGPLKRPIRSVDDLDGATWAVSRMGSGSHLMASVLAATKGWKSGAKFQVTGKFKALRDSVNAGDTDAFMWETFTTKPYHDSGEVRRVGEIYTPWPCFMIATRSDVIESRKKDLRELIMGMSRAAKAFNEESKTMPSFVAKQFGLKLQDAQAWYEKVDIVSTTKVDPQALLKAQAALVNAGVLTPAQGSLEAEHFIAHVDV